MSNIPDPAPVTSTIDTEDGEPTVAPKPKLDRLFKRNIILVGGFVLLALAIIVVIVMRTNSAMNKSAEKGMATTVIGIGASEKGSQVGAMTEAESERLKRVGQQQSDQAKAAGNSFIPKDMPLSSDVRPPSANDKAGPGGNYDMNSGRVNTNAASNAANAADSKREQLIAQGLERQMTHILAQFESPPTNSAGPYVDRAVKAAVAANAATPANPTSSTSTSSSSSSSASAPDWIPGLGIFGAKLTSPLDTAKTNYISAKVTNGPAEGALVFGEGKVVGAEGVRLSFNLMAFEGKTYAIKAVALDTQTSSNAMEANIDRQIFARYVIPIFGAIGQAYSAAKANPGQQVVNGVSGTTVVSPAATAEQAGYGGLAAGIGKLTEAATYTGPNTAFMPVNASIGLLFTEPVKKVAQ